MISGILLEPESEILTFILHYTVLYSTILYHPIQYYTILYSTILCHPIPYYVLLYSIIPYYTTPYYTLSGPCGLLGPSPSPAWPWAHSSRRPSALRAPHNSLHMLTHLSHSWEASGLLLRVRNQHTVKSIYVYTYCISLHVDTYIL